MNSGSRSPSYRPGVVEWLVAIVPALMAVGFYWLRSSNRTGYYQFVREDGPAEIFQAASVFCASIMAAVLAVRLVRSKQKVLGGLLVGFSLATFLVFGEEISWGQRIFGWSSNDYFQSVNMQAETNLHNDVRLKNVVHPTLIAIGLYATFSPLLCEALVRRRKAFLSFFTTEFPLVGYFSIFAAVYVVYEYLNPVIRPHYNGFDMILWQDLELAETFFYAGVFGWTVLKFRRAKELFAAPKPVRVPPRRVPSFRPALVPREARRPQVAGRS